MFCFCTIITPFLCRSVVWWWNRGESVNNKETTYVDSVLHIGVHYIDFFTVFSCELSGTGEGVSITKKPRMLTVCCTLVCII